MSGSPSNRMLVALIAVAVIALLAWRLVPAFERHLIYFPLSLPRDDSPPRLAAGRVQELELRTSDGVTISAWHVLTLRPRIGTLLFFHGNGGNVATRAPQLDELAALGLDVFIIDYRGYGKSEGTPSESGLYRDADAAYAYLRSELGLDPGEILLFGESLGSAIAIDLAVREPVAGLVVEAALTSVRDVGRIAYPFIPGFVYGLISHRFDSLGKIPRLRVPALFIHGTDDEILPIRMGRRLYEAAPEPRSWFEVPGAHHNDVFVVGGERYYRRLEAFARETLRSTGRVEDAVGPAGG